MAWGLVVLERLSPPERVAFVLHDLFNLPFEDIGPIIARTPPAARQLASRARRRVQCKPEATAADRCGMEKLWVPFWWRHATAISPPC